MEENTKVFTGIILVGASAYLLLHMVPWFIALLAVPALIGGFMIGSAKPDLLSKLSRKKSQETPQKAETQEPPKQEVPATPPQPDQ